VIKVGFVILLLRPAYRILVIILTFLHVFLKNSIQLEYCAVRRIAIVAKEYVVKKEIIFVTVLAGLDVSLPANV